MGISLSCCLCLDDSGRCLPIVFCLGCCDDPQERGDDRTILNPDARIAEPLSAPTRLSAPVRSAPATARSTATEPLLFAYQPAVVTSAPSLPRSSACAYTTRSSDPAPRPLGSATLTTPPTPAPRLPQASVQSRGPSSSSVRTEPVKREVSAAIREVNAAQLVRALSNNRPALSPPPAISSSLLPQSLEAQSLSHLLGGSTAVRTHSVKREAASDLPGVASTQDVYGLSEKLRQKSSSAGAESSKTQAPKQSPARPSKNAATPKMLDRLSDRTRTGSSTAAIPVYEIPLHLKEMIELDKVPGILKESLSASNYSEYFACLLYAEDFYTEKWNNYLLQDVTLEFYKRPSKNGGLRDNAKYSHKLNDYVAFEIDSIPAKRPYILSRDFVFLRPLETNHRIQGRVVRVQKSTKVLVEFEDDFWLQHTPKKRYDVSFSFNRVCLKRAHHAVANALSPVLFGFLFPEEVHKDISRLEGASLEYKKRLAVYQIRDMKGFPPYLIAGPPCLKIDGSLSEAGLIIREAIIQIYRAHRNCRVLICTARNTTCDKLLTELSGKISKTQQFRANAAFRDHEDVPGEILSSCQFDVDNDCFTCPPFDELQAFKVVTSTYMSSFRLRRAGIKPGHFTHIFLVDACVVTEPEAVVPLANFATEDTAVAISGCERRSPWYVRSDTARYRGLKTSYFGRLLWRKVYENDYSFICRLSEESG